MRKRKGRAPHGAGPGPRESARYSRLLRDGDRRRLALLADDLISVVLLHLLLRLGVIVARLGVRRVSPRDDVLALLVGQVGAILRVRSRLHPEHRDLPLLPAER